MSLIKNDYPILEYDTESKAIIMPGHSTDFHFPERAVMLFMDTEVEDYALENDCEIIRQYISVTKLFPVYKTKVLSGIDEIGISHTVPQGAYYVLLDISEFGYESDLEFCCELAEKLGVGAVPGSSFFRENVNHLIRLHFAKKDETLYEALNRLESIRRKMNK